MSNFRHITMQNAWKTYLVFYNENSYCQLKIWVKCFYIRIYMDFHSNMSSIINGNIGTKNFTKMDIWYQNVNTSVEITLWKTFKIFHGKLYIIKVMIFFECWILSYKDNRNKEKTTQLIWPGLRKLLAHL